MAAIVYWGEDAGGFNFLFFIFSKIGVNNWLGNYFGKVGFGLLAYWEYIEPNFLAPPPPPNYGQYLRKYVVQNRALSIAWVFWYAAKPKDLFYELNHVFSSC